ncbi:MAG: conjugal transfer protein TraJ [Ferrimonas sp.]
MQKKETPIAIKVYANSTQKELIKLNAKACGISSSNYLLSLGLGNVPQSNLDTNAVLDLMKVNGDLGRLGGLLKLWLTSDAKVAHFDVRHIKELLNRIELTHSKLDKGIREFLLSNLSKPN